MAHTTATNACMVETLAFAIVENAQAPLLLLDRELRVLAASGAFREAFAPRDKPLDGRRLFELDPHTWDVPQLRRALMRTLSGALVDGRCELNCASSDKDVRRLSVNTRKVPHEKGADSPLLMTITDVTDDQAMKRERLRLAQEKGALLSEVARHRTHIENLCESVGVSMSYTHGEFALDVLADSGRVDPRLSADIGAIVAELVIRTLAHAKPNFVPDPVQLDCHPEGWRLVLRERSTGTQGPILESGAAAGAPRS